MRNLEFLSEVVRSIELHLSLTWLRVEKKSDFSMKKSVTHREHHSFLLVYIS